MVMRLRTDRDSPACTISLEGIGVNPPRGGPGFIIGSGAGAGKVSPRPGRAETAPRPPRLVCKRWARRANQELGLGEGSLRRCGPARMEDTRPMITDRGPRVEGTGR